MSGQNFSIQIFDAQGNQVQPDAPQASSPESHSALPEGRRDITHELRDTFRDVADLIHNSIANTTVSLAGAIDKVLDMLPGEGEHFAPAVSKFFHPTIHADLERYGQGGFANQVFTAPTSPDASTVPQPTATAPTTPTPSSMPTGASLAGSGPNVGATLAGMAPHIAMLGAAIPAIQILLTAIANAGPQYQAQTAHGQTLQNTVNTPLMGVNQVNQGIMAGSPTMGVPIGTVLIGLFAISDAFIGLVDTINSTAEAMELLVKPWEENLAAARGMQKVDQVLLDLERAQYLGPEAATTTQLQTELNRAFMDFVTTIGKPALQIFNKGFDLFNTFFIPWLEGVEVILTSLLEVGNGVLTTVGAIADATPFIGSIYRGLKDWRNEISRGKKLDAMMEMDNFMLRGIVNKSDGTPIGPAGPGGLF